MKSRVVYLFAAACSFCSLAGLTAGFAAEPELSPAPAVVGNMLGNQSQNSGLPSIPAKGPVTIDGRLDDWDLSGRMASFADIHLRDEYSVETSSMWDQDYLYLALRWNDPTPLVNNVDPKFNANDGWKSDSVQLRVKTDHLQWITAWQYSADLSSNLRWDRWKDQTNPKGGQDSTLYFGKPGATDIGDGIQMAFSREEGGCVQELRLPWKLLYKEKPAIVAGGKIRIGFEFIWGTATGKDWPAHRYADNMQPGTTNRQFFWTAQNAWGDVELMPAGNLPLRQYRAAGTTLSGAVQVKLSIPKQAKKITVVIENDQGVRVRNLVADTNPADYAVAVGKDAYEVELAWDGADDEGAPVAVGTYRVRGLWHEGLDAIFDMTFYNPGTPAWQTPDGSGAWGADHHPPHGVVAAGDWMIVSWDFAEGGSGLIGVGPDGLKKWGEKRGSPLTAANSRHVFSIMSGWHSSGNLCRYDAKTGAYAPFVLDGIARPFELLMTDIIPDAPKPREFKGVDLTKHAQAFVIAMTADAKRLVLALADNRLAVVDSESAKLLQTIPVAKPSALAFGPGGELYVVSDGALHAVDFGGGKTSAIPTPGLAKAGAIAVNREGHIAIMDLGVDDQVKVYSPAGALVSTRGKKGGRPIRGTFEPQAMSHVTAIAFDGKGDLWAAENWDYPRRVSVWGRDGKLVRDYIGNTGYSGSGTYLYPEDPSLAYVGMVELKLDREKRTSSVRRILWKADETRADEPKTFDLDGASNVVGQRFRSSASGKPREYLFKQPSYIMADPSVLFMEDADGGWRPVAAVGLVGQISGDVGPKGREVLQPPGGEYAGLSAWDGFFWNYENNDGRVQRNECVIVPAVLTPGKPTRPPAVPPIPMGATWNNTMDPRDLSWLTTGIFRIKPLRYTPEGAPVYGPAGIEQVTDIGRFKLGDKRWLNPVVTSETERIIAIQTLYAPGHSPAFIGINAKTDATEWTYPNRYPGVHSSHKAPMPKAGLLIGPLKVLGTAVIDNGVGEVIAIRGNAGQDFFFTTDGLNVGSLFRDTRYPSGGLPPTEAEIAGRSLASLSEGGEPFSGWFGRQSDGRIRLTMSLARESGLIAEIKGLSTIRRFDAAAVSVTAADLEKAAADRLAAKAAVVAREPYRIAKVGKALPLTGPAAGWSDIAALAIGKDGSPEKAQVQLAHDGATLYLRAVVTDASPLKNEGKDFARLFKTGDAVDLQLGPAETARVEPVAGDNRVVFSVLGGQPVAVLMRPIDAGAPAAVARTYVSPVGPRHFARVGKIAAAQVVTTWVDGGYVLTASLPLADLGISPVAGLKLRGDVGFISSDAAGRVNIARTYWANQNTALVSDEPQEAWLFPKNWGDLILE